MDELEPFGGEPTDAERAAVSALVVQLQEAEQRVIAATKELSNALVELRQIQEVDLVTAMHAVNMSSFALADGTPVKITSRLIAGQLSSEEGLQWVTDHGGESLIKAEVTIGFDRTDIDKARAVYDELHSRWSNVAKKLDIKETVHPSTLIHFCNELIGNQEADPPLDVLGVHRHTRAQVGAKQPKTVKLTGLLSREGFE